MIKKAAIPPPQECASPLAIFMKGLIGNNKINHTEIIADNPRRLRNLFLREMVTVGDCKEKKLQRRWEGDEKNEFINCPHCPQRRASVDEDFDFSDSSDLDEDDTTHSFTIPRDPISPSSSYNDAAMPKNSTGEKMQYQMALQMVQQKYATSTISSPLKAPKNLPRRRQYCS